MWTSHDVSFDRLIGNGNRGGGELHHERGQECMIYHSDFVDGSRSSGKRTTVYQVVC